MRTKVITSFSAGLWDQYAHKCIVTWVEHLKLDEGSVVEIWINGAFPEGLPMATKHGNPITYKMLDVQSQGWKYFYDTFKNHPKPNTQQGQEFRFNFLPFSCKVYALAEATWLVKEDQDFDLLMWLDADCEMKQDVTSSYLSEVLGTSHFAWLDRSGSFDYGETGFMLSRTNDQVLDLFLHQANIYGSGQLFFLREWHDAFVLSSCIKYKQFTDGENFIVKNLNEDKDSQMENGLYPFKTSVLKDYFEHHKGHLKGKIG